MPSGKSAFVAHGPHLFLLSISYCTRSIAAALPASGNTEKYKVYYSRKAKKTREVRDPP